MKFDGLPVSLDRAKPFVQAVCKTFEENGDIYEAVLVLESEEQKHRVGVWREPSGESELSCGYFALQNPLQKIPLPEVMQLIRNMDEFRKHYITDWESVNRSRYVEPKLIAQSLFPFLTDTNLIVNGSHFTDDHFVLYEDGSISAWTSRGWGTLMAQWANETDWGAHYNKKGDKYKWNYVNFYVGLDPDIFENYFQWEEAVFKVLKLKTELTLKNARA